MSEEAIFWWQLAGRLCGCLLLAAFLMGSRK